MNTVVRIAVLVLSVFWLANDAIAESRLVTPQVVAVTRIAMEACIDKLVTGQPLAGLEASGFSPRRNGYKANVENPLIFAGDSTVRVVLERNGECVVETDPVVLAEVGTIQSLLKETLASRGVNLNVRFLHSMGEAKTKVVFK
jgi:hypothetical protein